jgi:hypothetical protein
LFCRLDHKASLVVGNDAGLQLDVADPAQGRGIDSASISERVPIFSDPLPPRPGFPRTRQDAGPAAVRPYCRCREEASTARAGTSLIAFPLGALPAPSGDKAPSKGLYGSRVSEAKSARHIPSKLSSRLRR